MIVLRGRAAIAGAREAAATWPDNAPLATGRGVRMWGPWSPDLFHMVLSSQPLVRDCPVRTPPRKHPTQRQTAGLGSTRNYGLACRLTSFPPGPDQDSCEPAGVDSMEPLGPLGVGLTLCLCGVISA